MNFGTTALITAVCEKTSVCLSANIKKNLLLKQDFLVFLRIQCSRAFGCFGLRRWVFSDNENTIENSNFFKFANGISVIRNALF